MANYYLLRLNSMFLGLKFNAACIGLIFFPFISCAHSIAIRSVDIEEFQLGLMIPHLLLVFNFSAHILFMQSLIISFSFLILLSFDLEIGWIPCPYNLIATFFLSIIYHVFPFVMILVLSLKGRICICGSGKNIS